MAATPGAFFRVPVDVLERAKARAKAEGITVTSVVVHALRRFGEGATNNVMPPPRA